jgi:hypothetical protein
VQDSERRYAGQIARSQERLRRLAMFGEDFVEHEARLGFAILVVKLLRCC